MSGAVAHEFLSLQKALVGRYSLEREVGRGGMGIVFLARDVELDRPVAIKLLPPQLAAQASLRERFLSEARMAARLSHPNIIPIFDVDEVDGLVFFTMAYVEGETLGQRVRARGPLNPREATRVIQEVAWALAYAHLRGIVHRDIKPDNILLEQGAGRALVSDFGIARAGTSSGQTAVGEVIGTAQYMSPEQACGEQVDGRSDLYSLGVVAFYALSGKLPFDAPDVPALLAQHITKPAPPLAAAAPGAPKKVCDAVDRCLAKDPAQRFSTGEALAEALSQSADVAREIPAPIRVWLTKGEGLRPVLNVWTGVTGIVALIKLIGAVFEGSGFDIDVLLMLAMPWGVFALARLYQTQRVIAAGYGIEDLREALRQQIEQRREELAYEFDREPSRFAKLVRWTAWFGLLPMAAGTIYAGAAAIPHATIGAVLLGGGAALSLGCAVIGRFLPGKRLKPRDPVLEFRLKLAGSRLGRLMFRIAGIGVRRAALPAAHRPTEVAIGLAAEALFEALPKEMRRELKDLPDVLRRLENDARLMRARVEELNAMLATAEAGAAQESASLRSAEGAAVIVAGERSRVREQLTAERDAAQKRLAASVAALENVRLDLLRLKAGVGSLDELSADLAAARDVQEELARAIEAREAVESELTLSEDRP
ncbi:MAG TPA: protein kinase [Gemmatimonadales bacterium]|nr:protein kinase [Gemmatimonadales bacterium]